ncbi:S1C family serine protease [Pseudonocardia acaciae]|uniref:S1C family serine protease n=1 Tax=Pseudonocardia acaciae TaxID=551276 RepID=UPI000684BDCE|nr:trypsin-like peptidase domain-containing protein [Pseudonocardia acaciae]
MRTLMTGLRATTAAAAGVAVTAVAVVAVFVGFVGCSTAPPVTGPPKAPPAAPPGESPGQGGTAATESGYEQVVRDVLPSVVQITSDSGLGSGVVYDDKGHIVTNAHVVGTDTRFQVTFATGTTPTPATLVASYPPDDLAVIKVDGPVPVRPATFGDSSKLAVGQLVLAMGNPLGLSSSVADGIVSAVGRTVTEPRSQASPGGTSIADMVQTSAAINPGNSGGALVDMNRNVIGIPTLAATDAQLGGAAPGIGFAISSNTVRRIADQIIADGKVTNSGRAALGVVARTVIDFADRLTGAGVVEVLPGGGAQKAGLRAGDIITKVANTETRTIVDLNKALASVKPGDQVPVAFVRDGRPQAVNVTLGQL